MLDDASSEKARLGIDSACIDIGYRIHTRNSSPERNLTLSSSTGRVAQALNRATAMLADSLTSEYYTRVGESLHRVCFHFGDRGAISIGTTGHVRFVMSRNPTQPATPKQRQFGDSDARSASSSSAVVGQVCAHTPTKDGNTRVE